MEPLGRVIEVAADENVLGAALAAGIPLPHSCRAGRCATCKARLVSGEIAYPDGALPPGIVASEAARGEVLLCQARPRSDLVIQSRSPRTTTAHGVLVESVAPLSSRGWHVRLKILGSASLTTRPGQFIDVESASGERERVPVVAASAASVEVEVHDLEPGALVRAHGPFDSLR